jgi:uncharacterized MAPEG superfamily protein
MTIPFWCLLIAAILPIVLSWVSGYYRNKQLGTIDNKNPRQQNAQLTGPGARAVAAQQNAWEALAVFTAAVMVSHFLNADADTAATAALVFIAARIIHGITYVANLDALRSLAFLVSFGSSLWLFLMAA